MENTQTTITQETALTNEQLVDQWLNARGLHKEKEDSTVGLLMPYLLLDLASSIFWKHLAPLKPRHEAKRLLNRWRSMFTAQTRDFFHGSDKRFEDGVIAKMDAFEEYISNDLTILRITLLNEVQGGTREQQDLLVYAALCNLLLRDAEESYALLYRRAGSPIYIKAGNAYYNNIKDARNEGLTNLASMAVKFVNEYFKGSGIFLKCNGVPKIDKAVQALSNKIVRWLYVDRDESRAEELS